MHDVLSRAVDLHQDVVRRSGRSERGVEGLGDHAGQTGFRGKLHGFGGREAASISNEAHNTQYVIAGRVQYALDLRDPSRLKRFSRKVSR
jgi:hypothetical protein